MHACALCLGFPVEDANGRIYSNKPSLVMRIILEIEALFPATCAECSGEYCNSFDSENTPALRCFLCF